MSRKSKTTATKEDGKPALVGALTPPKPKSSKPSNATNAR